MLAFVEVTVMRASRDVAPPNSIILVMDPSSGVIPMQIGEGLVAATPSCVAVGTLSELDGATRITLRDEAAPTGTNQLVFDGELGTPTRNLAICTVLGAIVLETHVAGSRTRVQVWASDLREPSEVEVVVIGAPP